MPRIEKKKQKMIDAAYVLLDAADETLAAGLVPNDADLALANIRLELACAWIELARETNL